jgi:hypothetical protein
MSKQLDWRRSRFQGREREVLRAVNRAPTPAKDSLALRASIAMRDWQQTLSQHREKIAGCQ